MINEDWTPNTAHTKNPVPCILVSRRLTENEKLKNGRLADVAPTLLALMGMGKGKEMTGGEFDQLTTRHNIIVRSSLHDTKQPGSHSNRFTELICPP